MCEKLALALFSDAGYRFNDNMTDTMPDDEKVRYLWAEARKYVEGNHQEIGYGILRELLWVSPEHSVEAWALLAHCAQAMLLDDESRAAMGNAEILSNRSA